MKMKEKNMPKKPEDSKPRDRRKVHFELVKSTSIDSDDEHISTINPKYAIQFDQCPPSKPSPIASKKDERKVHGTANYVNGTLNFSMNDYKTTIPIQIAPKVAKKDIQLKPILFRNQFTNDASAKNAQKNYTIDQQYWDNAVSRRGILLHVSAENQQSNNIKFRTNKLRRYTSMLLKPSKYLQRSKKRSFHNLRSSASITSNKLELPTPEQLNKMHNTKLKSNSFDKFSYKLIKIKKPSTKKCSPVSDNELQASAFDERALSIVQNAFNEQQHELEQHCTSENLSEILQLAHRWQTTMETLPTRDIVSTRESSTSVGFCTLKKLDVKQ